MVSTILFKNNEEGSAIILAVLILAVLTILGVSSTNTSITELQIVRNERIYQQNFYQAESAAYEAAKRIEDATNTDQLIPSATTLDWMNNNTIDLTQSNIWQDFGLDSGNVSDTSDASLISLNAYFSAVAKGVRIGSSLDIGSSRLYEFAVFGLSEENRGKGLIEIGYLRRF